MCGAGTVMEKVEKFLMDFWLAWLQELAKLREQIVLVSFCCRGHLAQPCHESCQVFSQACHENRQVFFHDGGRFSCWPCAAVPIFPALPREPQIFSHASYEGKGAWGRSDVCEKCGKMSSLQLRCANPSAHAACPCLFFLASHCHRKTILDSLHS